MIITSDSIIKTGSKRVTFGMTKEQFLDEFGFGTECIGYLSCIDKSTYSFKVEKITTGDVVATSIVFNEKNKKEHSFLIKSLTSDFNITSFVEIK